MTSTLMQNYSFRLISKQFSSTAKLVFVICLNSESVNFTTLIKLSNETKVSKVAKVLGKSSINTDI